MALVKHEIPLLEYDDASPSIILPTHEGLDLHLPPKAVFAFLEGHVDAYAKRHHCPVLGEFISATKSYPIYQVTYGDEEVCLCQAPVGAAPAAQLMDWLIGYGVRQIISSGSCGCLIDIPENTFLVPTRALRDEGTSYHYLPPSRFVDIQPAALQAIEATFAAHGYHYQECTTWSTDGFYRETRDKVEYRKQEGCAVVEMECSALAAVAQFRGVLFGQVLFTADTLADLDNYDERDWGDDSYAKALELCLEVLSRM